MAKLVWPPGALLAPVPVALVTCADGSGRDNVFTVAWTGLVCTKPPMLSISVRRERHSWALLDASGQCGVNLVDQKLVRAADLCGVTSGRDNDKFEAAGITRAPASRIAPPLVAESPLSLECIVRERKVLGSHELFLCEIVAVQVEETLVDERGKLDLAKAGLVAWAHGEYLALGKPLGFFGFSVRRRKTLKRDRS